MHSPHGIRIRTYHLTTLIFWLWVSAFLPFGFFHIWLPKLLATVFRRVTLKKPQIIFSISRAEYPPDSIGSQAIKTSNPSFQGIHTLFFQSPYFKYCVEIVNVSWACAKDSMSTKIYLTAVNISRILSKQ